MQTGPCWLMIVVIVILTTWEVRAGGLQFQAKPWWKMFAKLCHNRKKAGHGGMCLSSSYHEKHKIRGSKPLDSTSSKRILDKDSSFLIIEQWKLLYQHLFPLHFAIPEAKQVSLALSLLLCVCMYVCVRVRVCVYLFMLGCMCVFSSVDGEEKHSRVSQYEAFQ
jgi:hypothetical protein